MELIATRISSQDLNAAVAWAEGLDVKIPDELWRSLPSEMRQEGGGRLVAKRVLMSGAERWVGEVRERAAFTLQKPTSSRLPISYQRIPGFVRAQIARVIGARQRRRQAQWAAFPSWPLDLSADFLADWLEMPTRKFEKTPVLLSHDLDSLEGLQNAVAMFLSIEEEFGARSTNYIVPCGWEIDHGLLGELHGRGHPVGVHGYDHSNKTPFAEPAEMESRVRAAVPLIERYQIRGYRAPSLLRTPQLLKTLSAHYSYDSSIPTSGGAFPVPNNGCASARPFRIQGIWEIPLSMPRDGSLRFLGYKPKEILATWIACADRVSESGGIVSFLNHCERHFSGNPEMLAIYRDFLAYLSSSPKYRFTTAEELVNVL